MGLAPGLRWVDLGPGVRAAFTTVAGGLSTGPWASLNLGLATGDHPDRVHANRELIESAVGVPIVYATQVHGSHVAVLNRPRLDKSRSCGEADAIVVSQPGLGAAVLVADCVPVLLADPMGGVVAVAHAGRAGTLSGVVGRTVAKMCAQGARPDRIRAAIGPAACGRCYEVPEQMRSEAEDRIPGISSTTTWGTSALDLPGAVAGQLRAEGVTSVRRSTECTLEDTSFFSYRVAQRSGAATGRFAGVIGLTPDDAPPPSVHGSWTETR